MGDGKSLPLLLPQTYEDLLSAPVTCAVSLLAILFSYLQNDKNRPHPPWVGSAGLVLHTDVLLNPSPWVLCLGSGPGAAICLG